MKLYRTISIKLISTCFLLGCITTVQAQDSINKTLSESLSKLNSTVTALTESIEPAKSVAPKNQTILTPRPVDTFQKILVLAPLVTGLIVLLLVFNNLKANNYKLSEALADTESVPKTEEIKNLDGSVSTTTTNTTLYLKSSSRLVMFISSIMTVIISLCLVSFYIYQMFSVGEPPNFSSISTLLLTLGIGVVPYAFNKMAK